MPSLSEIAAEVRNLEALLTYARKRLMAARLDACSF